jgi:acyl-CoA reductase-like NAD-dependent aldehyde dehydrogenase
MAPQDTSPDDVLREETYPLVINGERIVTDGESIPVVNPATEEVVATAAAAEEQHVNRAVEAAEAATNEWRSMKPPERGRILRSIAEAIRDEADHLAAVLTFEAGKPLSQAKSDVEGAARYFEYYAGLADKIHGKQIPLGDDYTDYTIREPLGVTAHIVPWNYPADIIGRTCAPALAAGNTTVLKPAEQTPLTAVEVVQIAHNTGLPPGALNVVNGYGATVGAPLAGHRDIDGVSFTGSVKTGSEVAKLAAGNLNHVHIEAGGKNPNVIFSDADLDRAVDNTVASLFGANAGQVCSAGDRVLVQESIHDEFVDALLEKTADLTVGPGIEDPDVGPLVSSAQFEKVSKYIDLGYTEAGEPLLGGRPPERKGFFIEPTIFDGASNDARISQEEIFGPVLPVTTFEDEHEAIAMANNVSYGLVAGISTSDVGRAHRFAREVEAGQIYVNEWYAGGVETPFGGFKNSGFGREKGVEAIQEFTQTKNVALDIRRYD